MRNTPRPDASDPESRHRARPAALSRRASKQRHGHRDFPLRSSARPEQLIEEIAEPCLEHVELGVGDRHSVGPIVRDGPCLNIMLGRAADARPGRRLDLKIVRQNAQAGAWSGHPRSIAPLGPQANDRFLSANALLLPGKPVTRGALALSSDLWQALAGPATAGQGRSREAVARNAPALAGWRRSGLLAPKRSWFSLPCATA